MTSFLTSLGLNADRTVQVPTSYEQLKVVPPWPNPGHINSAVIQGQVEVPIS